MKDINEIYWEITTAFTTAGAELGYHWLFILIALSIIIPIVAVIDYLNRPKKYKIVADFSRPLDDLKPGMYSITFYSDGVKKLD